MEFFDACLMASIVGSLTTLMLLCCLKPLALRVGLLDSPGGHKHHRHPVPVIGGIAMFGGFFSATISLPGRQASLLALLASLGALVIVGLCNDRRELFVGTRFAVQIGAALLMIYWGEVALYELGALFWPGATITLGLAAVPFTVFSTVGVINAMNMLDGMDGLAGGMAGCTLLILGLTGLLAGLHGDALLLFAAGAAVFTFLSFNLRLPRWQKCADVFMGDSGSMFLGLLLAWFFIKLSQGEPRAFTPVTALYLFALPLLDTVTLMIRRILKGRSPFTADRQHLHHLLLRAGCSVNQSVLILWSISLALASVGLAGFYLQVAENVLFYAFLGLFVLYFHGTWKAVRSINDPTARDARKASAAVSSFN